MTFSDYFHPIDFSSREKLPTNSPLAKAVELIGSFQSPNVLLKDVQGGNTANHPIPIFHFPTIADNGAFRYNLIPDKLNLPYIMINMNSNDYLMTVAHEMGHAMDHLLKVHFMGSSSVSSTKKIYASEYDIDPLQPWWTAVQQTAAYKQIQAMDLGALAAEPCRSENLLFATRRETFACSFAQFIALKSGDPKFIAHLDARRTSRSGQKDRYWQSADFLSINTTLEHLFSEIGW
ncbi:hypothetical protein [Deinococcus sp. QL22]|uniref:hypothetical protein n=1 Tax=Deinococcus sp. QL22 TaxID=2939437 RepID=UPI0020183712|nr:hypothetical protein [Deinococcus sp. QL22]UQN06503.1 hypothetical protein M1R55_00875 [Deinococcus sp. QL22]